MGLQMDWEIETDDRQEQIAPPPPESGGRWRRWWLWLLGLALVAGGAFGIARHELRRIDERLRADLESTVAAETLALRIGDERAFRRIQADDREWRAEQAREFVAYQRGESLYRALTGEIEAVEIDGDQAQVMLAAEQNGVPFCVLWAYDYGERGWLHAASDPFGCDDGIHIETGAISVRAYEPDRENAEALAERLAGWWQGICTQVGCEEPPPLNVQLIPSSNDGLLLAGEDTLVIPSATFGADTALGDHVLPGLITRYWVDALLARYDLPREQRQWADNQAWAWVRSGLEGNEQGGLFPVIAQVYGRCAVHHLLERLADGEDVGEAVARVVSPQPAGSLSGEALEMALEEQLTVESMLYAHVARLTQPVRALYRDETRHTAARDDRSPVRYARPESIDVLGVEQRGDILWARLSWRSRTTLPLIPFPSDDSFPEVDSLISYIPFRQVEGRWLRTVVLGEDYGAELQQSRGLVTVRYRELDEPHAQALLGYLNEIYPSVAAEFGLQTLPPVEVTLTPSSREYLAYQFNSSMPPVPPGDVLAFTTLSSFYEHCCRTFGEEPLRDYIRRNAGEALVEAVAAYAVSPQQSHYYLRSALVQHVKELYAGAARPPLTSDALRRLGWQQEPGRLDPAFIDQTWAAIENPGNRNPVYLLGAEVLVGMLLEEHGEESLPVLFRSLAGAPTLDEWLSTSVGVEAAAVEQAWRVRYEAAVMALWEEQAGS